MTEKRFTVEKIEMVSDHRSTRFYIKDNLEDKSYDVQHIVSEEFEVQFDSWADAICDKWNNLNDENEQLKERVKTLKQDNDQLKLQLDYIQLSITEAIQHSKTELEQDALKKVIENYNEYMLGHKELSE